MTAHRSTDPHAAAVMQRARQGTGETMMDTTTTTEREITASVDVPVAHPAAARAGRIMGYVAIFGCGVLVVLGMIATVVVVIAAMSAALRWGF